MNHEDRLKAITEGIEHSKIKIEVEFNRKLLFESIYVHCKTEEEARILLNWADKNKMKWCDKDSFKNIVYDKFKDKSCYNIYKGKVEPYDYVAGNCFALLEFKDALI